MGGPPSATAALACPLQQRSRHDSSARREHVGARRGRGPRGASCDGATQRLERSVATLCARHHAHAYAYSLSHGCSHGQRHALRRAALRRGRIHHDPWPERWPGSAWNHCMWIRTFKNSRCASSCRCRYEESRCHSLFFLLREKSYDNVTKGEEKRGGKRLCDYNDSACVSLAQSMSRGTSSLRSRSKTRSRGRCGKCTS